MNLIWFVFFLGSPFLSADSEISSHQETTNASTLNYGALEKVTTVCASCHGVEGYNFENPVFPNLAGQQIKYLENQLIQFALPSDQSQRPSEIMQNFAAMLTVDEIKEILRYYSELKKIKNEAPADSNIPLGRSIYYAGIKGRGVPACSSCHGAAGYGNGPAGYPSLAGQNYEYINDQLRKYRDHERRHDMMTEIAGLLTEVEADAVARYLQGLRSH